MPHAGGNPGRPGNRRQGARRPAVDIETHPAHPRYDRATQAPHHSGRIVGPSHSGCPGDRQSCERPPQHPRSPRAARRVYHRLPSRCAAGTPLPQRLPMRPSSRRRRSVLRRAAERVASYFYVASQRNIVCCLIYRGLSRSAPAVLGVHQTKPMSILGPGISEDRPRTFIDIRDGRRLDIQRTGQCEYQNARDEDSFHDPACSASDHRHGSPTCQKWR